MPRPCQKRRETAAAQRKSKPSAKPSGPPPIRHKARQKAIHNNARRGRGGARGGARGGSRGGSRGGGRGGRPSQYQQSDKGIEANQDFIAFASNGNNFHMLDGAGSRHDPIALDEDDSLEDGELTDDASDDDDDSDDLDLDLYDADALTINVELGQMHRERPKRATVMFPVRQAIAIYRGLYEAGFPLLRTSVSRYGRAEPGMAPATGAPPQTAALGVPQYLRVAFKADVVVPPRLGQVGEPPLASSSHASPAASTSMSRQPSASTATSGASTRASAPSHAARDYTFDWGVHSGKQFAQVPEHYLRMIAGNPVLLDKHPGVREAFDHHRPGMRRTGPTKKELARQAQQPVQAASRGRNQGTRGGPAASWVNFRFPSGIHQRKKLNEVPENYLRTIEGMDHVMNKWEGLKEALLDFNRKTGRHGRVLP